MPKPVNLNSLEAQIRNAQRYFARTGQVTVRYAGMDMLDRMEREGEISAEVKWRLAAILYAKPEPESQEPPAEPG